MYIVKIINKCIFVSKLINRLWKYLFLVFMIYLCMDIFNKVIKNNNGYVYIFDYWYLL